ncbi:MAG: hypothetical protein FKY71_13535 [Spiribacter salinus]|uniref:Phage head morphogenesis domain-containing protein n=1 Tax=Spiribacter salinus TaxID=1335746 RepID=A0A540VP05_9GAMM|nr:MAG: hypothetical protein FKY71_13535 [Spiribacter salinus]
MCDRFGVEWEPELDAVGVSPDMHPCVDDDIGDEVNGELWRSVDSPAKQLQDYQSQKTFSLKDISTPGDVRRFADDHPGPFDEVGAPGTRIRSGILNEEPVAKYRPYQVRGHVEQHGLYKKLYRQEPVLFSGINEGNNIFTSGDVKFVCPDVPRSQQRQAEHFTDFCNQWFRQQWRGPHYYQRHVGQAKIYGFYLFEVVWEIDGRGYIKPSKFAPREVSQVDRWIFGPRGDELVGVTCRIPSVSSGRAANYGAGAIPHSTSSSRYLTYTLTASGPSLTDHRVHVANIHATAANIEGISLIRPVIHWVKFKQLLSQIAAVTAQKYGAPMAVIKNDPKALEILGMTADQNDGATIFRQVSGQQANEAPTFQLEPGWDIEIMAPTGTMPSLEGLIDYCDQMIAKPTHSEGGLLGSNTVGSYALSQTMDNSLLRAQPGFAAEALQSLDWIVRDIAKWHGVTLDYYPRAVWEMDGFSDNSRWIEDATSAMGGMPMNDWPPEMQKEALKKLNLPASTFDDYQAPEASQSTQGAQFSDAKTFAPEKYSDLDFSAPSGARDAAERGLDYRREYGRGGTDTGIARARDIARGADLSPDTVRRMAAFFARHEKNRVPPTEKTEPDGGPTNGWIAWQLWGGDAGRTWSESMVERMSARDGKSMSCGCSPGDHGGFDMPSLGATLARFRGVRRDDNIIELRDTLTAANGNGLDAEAARRQMDQAEKRIGDAMRKVAQDHRRAYRELVRDGSMTPRQADQAMREEFLPRYEDAAREGLRDVGDKAKRQFLRDLGFTVARDARMPMTDAMEAALEASAYDVAAEFYGRQEGVMRRSVTEDSAAGDETGVPILEASTAALAARGLVGRAYNAGRDDMIETVQEAVPEAPQIIAKRSSMLDDRVCEPCRKRDFEEGSSPAVHVVGSQAYYDDMPPRHCLGKNRCRCVYIFEIPAEYEGSINDIARDQGFGLPPGGIT